MEIMARLESALLEIHRDGCHHAAAGAGAHGELTGILLVRALLEKRGNPRKKILIPDSAHGTNPATAAIAGYAVENLRSNARGTVDLAELERMVDKDVAALMVTNPNTIGVFEENITRAAEILHKKGALLYMDGANMNALWELQDRAISASTSCTSTCTRRFPLRTAVEVGRRTGCREENPGAVPADAASQTRSQQVDL